MQTKVKVRELFGLDEADELSEEVTLPPPTTSVGHGLVAVAVLGEEVKRLSHFTVDPALGDRLGINRVARWDGDARVIALGNARVTGVGGAAEFVPELGWILDTRCELAGVIVHATDDASRILIGERGEVTIARLRQGPARPIALCEPPPLELPLLEDLLERLGVHSWLREAVAVRARSESCVRQVAAVGLTRRLALGEVEAQGWLLEAQGAAGDPLRELDAWARDLGPEVVSALEVAVLDAAQGLAEEIVAWHRRVIGDGRDASIAASIRARRDDLESAACILRIARADTPVIDALDTLDAVAAVHLSELDAVGAEEDDDLFAAVSAAQPEAWWGTTWKS